MQCNKVMKLDVHHNTEEKICYYHRYITTLTNKLGMVKKH